MTAVSALRGANALHVGVREEIARRISEGLYAEGEPIPSAAQLSDDFGVSAITVKRALRDLQSSGVLTAVAGKGTFVKRQRRFLRELDIGMSSAEDAQRAGLSLDMELLSITKEKVTDPALLAFEPTNELGLCVRKIVSANGIAIMYDTTYVPTNTPDAIIDEFSRSLMADALRKNDISLTNIRLIIDAGPASPGSQRSFSIPSGYPVLRRLYHQRTTHPDISLVGIVESPFDRLACSISLPVDKGGGGRKP